MYEEKMDNPIQDDFDFDFGDQTEETVEETVEEPTQDPEVTEDSTETPEVTDTQEELPFDWASLELKGVDGVSKLGDMNHEEAQSTFRKGKDYDRIRPGYELSKQMKEIAGLYGMDPETMMNNLKEDFFKTKAESENTTADFEKRNYELTKQEAVKTKESEQKAKQQENINRFVDKYPEMTPADLPDEVLKAAASGEDMVTAYTMYMNQKMQKEMEQMKLQLSNAQKAPGASTTGHGTDENQSMSAFAKGFMD